MLELPIVIRVGHAVIASVIVWLGVTFLLDKLSYTVLSMLPLAPDWWLTRALYEAANLGTFFVILASASLWYFAVEEGTFTSSMLVAAICIVFLDLAAWIYNTAIWYLLGSQVIDPGAYDAPTMAFIVCSFALLGYAARNLQSS